MKILIVTKNWLGDILFQLPAIEMIAKNHPDAEIVCMAPARCHQILEAQPFVHRVCLFDEKKENRSLFSRLAFLFELRKEKWDKGYLLHRSRTRALLLKLAGVKELIGYGSKRAWLLTQPVAEPKEPMHQVDYFIHLLTQLGMEREAKVRYQFPFLPEDEKLAQEAIQASHFEKFICFHLGANWEPKRWPVKHFAQLADLLHQKYRIPVILTGAQRDLPLMREFMRHLREAKVHSLVGKTTLGELGAVFKSSFFVVSSDSGPMHIASGVGTRVVGLFGPTSPKLTGPRGMGETLVLSYVPPGFQSPWYGKNLPEKEWMSGLEPETVLEAIEKKDWIQKKQSVISKFKIKNLEFHHAHAHVDKILLVTLSNIGDVILTTPVLAALSYKYPHAKITVVVGPKAEGVLKHSRLIHRLVIYDKKAGRREKWEFLKELRRESYDLTIDLRNTAIPFLVNTKKRSPIFRSNQKLSMRDRHLEVLRRTGIVPTRTSGFDFYSQRDEQNVREKLQELSLDLKDGFLVVAPVAQSPLKTWPREGFEKVIRTLVGERTEKVLLVGSWEEHSELQNFTQINSSRVFNLAGKISLRELAYLISQAKLVLSNDSAAMHLGYELERPVVAIFGPTHPKKYGREGERFRLLREPVACSPCEKAVCAYERQHCFEDLKAEKVIQACRELLQESRVVQP